MWIQSASRLRTLQQGAGEMAGQSRGLNTLLEFLASPTDPEAMQCLSFLWSMSGLRVCVVTTIWKRRSQHGETEVCGESLPPDLLSLSAGPLSSLPAAALSPTPFSSQGSGV